MEKVMKHQLNGTNYDPPPAREVCIHELIQTRMLKQPQALAINAWDGQFTYAELDNLSSDLGAYLVEKGVRGEFYVPICMEKSRQAPLAMLAVLKAGGAFVLLDPAHPIYRIREICDAVGATLVVTSREQAPRLEELGFETILVESEAKIGSKTKELKDVVVKPTNAAYAMFTSGSSGIPKGVVMEHRSFCTSALSHSKAIELDVTSRVLQFSSFAFDVALTEILSTLIMGGCVCLPSEIDRKQNLSEAARALGINYAIFTPSLARVVETEDFACLGTLVLAGEAVHPEDVEKWSSRVKLFGAYGPTEAAVLSAVKRFVPGEEMDASNIGHGVGVTCWVVDPDDHNKLSPMGTMGELLLDGAPVARGYINNRKQTDEAFIGPPEWHRELRPSARGKLYKTGDLAVQDAKDWSIRYVGRKDSQVKVKGQRLETEEVEMHIRRCLENVRNVVVDLVLIDDRKELVAFLLLDIGEKNGDHTENRALGDTKSTWVLPPSRPFQYQIHALQSRLRNVVPQYMMPAFFLPLRLMPLMASGKRDRQSLRSLATNLSWHELGRYMSLSSTQNNTVPVGATELLLQNLWAEVLRIPGHTIGREDCFQSLGGDSLAAIKLAGLARKNGLELTVSQIYEHRILSAMALVSRPHSGQSTTSTAPLSLFLEPDSREAMISLAVERCQLSNSSQIEDVYPCSPLQAGLIALTAKLKRQGAYNITYEYRLPTDIDIVRFQSAWSAVVKSNPILRTRIIQARSGCMYQVVVQEDLTWELRDSQKPRESDLDWKLGQRLARFYLESTQPAQFRLSLHHAITDGWSISLLLEQVSLAYQGVDLKFRPFNSFVNFVCRVQNHNTKAFWKRQYADLRAITFPKLPSLDYVPNPRAKKVCIMESDVWSGLFTLANRMKLAWAILVCLYSASSDVIFGSIINGRSAPLFGIEEMTGPTIATIPIRLLLRPESTVHEALQEIQQNFIDTIPFEQTGLQNIRRMSPEAALACQFQSLLVVQSEEKPESGIFSKFKDLSERSAFAAYPITLECRPSERKIKIEVTFDLQILKTGQVDEMLDDLRQIFKQIIPSRRGSSIQSLNPNANIQWPDIKHRQMRLLDEHKQKATIKSGYKKPATDEQRVLHELFAEIVKISTEELSIDDNFFRLGGDSILAMNLVTRGKEEGLIFAVADIFECPTIASLAEKAQRSNGSQESQVLPFALIEDGHGLDEIFECATKQCHVLRRDIEDIYPCSGLQEGLMALTVKNPETYTARFEYVLPREIDSKRFQKAWSTVYSANSILRTRIFQSPAYGTFQAVLNQPLEWTTITSIEGETGDSDSSVMGLGAPLTHFALVPPSSRKTRPRFILTIHHAFFWASELGKLNAEIFPSLRQIDHTPNPNSSFNYTLSNLPAQKTTHTISTVLQLAWALVIAHYTDSKDVVYGLTVNGRTAPVIGISEVTGPTIATVPFRVILKLEKTVDNALSEIQQQGVRLIPFLHHGLQKIRQVSPDAAKACQFQSHLGIQPAGIMTEKTLGWLENLDKEEVQGYEGFVSYAFNMICHLSEGSGSIRIAVNHDSSVLEDIEAQRLVQQFQVVVHQLLSNSKSLLRDIEVISPQDMSTLSDWNRCVPLGTEKPLHDLVLRHSLETPHAEAVCASDGDLTYQQLDNLSARLACYIISQAQINQPQDAQVSQNLALNGINERSGTQNLFAACEFRIAVCLEKSKWTIVALIAVLRTGAACVLLDPSHPRQRLKQLIQKTTPQLVLASEVYKDLIRGLGTKIISIGAALIHRIEQLVRKPLPCVAPNHVAFILFTSGSTGKSKAVILEHVNLSTSVSAHSGALGLGRSSRALHFASYAFDASVYEIFDTLNCGGCLCIPSEYDRLNDLAGSINELRVNFAVLTPSTINLLRPDEIPGLRTLVTAGEPITRNLLEMWSSKLTLINAYGPLEATCCSVHHIPSVMDAWNTTNIGRTLGCVGWIVCPSNPAKLAAIGSVGELILEGSVVTRGYLDEPEKTASAFIERPPWLQSFRETFNSEGASSRLYKSGDLVSYNIDGTIRYVGRKDTQVKLRGQRIELGDVAYHVRGCWPDAVDVIVEIVCPVRDGTAPTLVAFIWTRNTKSSSTNIDVANEVDNLFTLPSEHFLSAAQEAETCLLASCPAYMVPALFLSLRHLPLTQTGKVDRRRLKETCSILLEDRILEYVGARKARRLPSTRIERILHGVWAGILSRKAESFGVDESFFRLGGDSISAMQVVSECAAAQLKTSVAAIFEHKTIAQVSLQVQEVGASANDESKHINNCVLNISIDMDEDKVESDIAGLFHVSYEGSSARLKAAFQNRAVTWRGKLQKYLDKWMLTASHNQEEYCFRLQHISTQSSAVPSAPLISNTQARRSSIFHLTWLSQHQDGGNQYYLSPTQHDLEVEDAYPCSPIQDGILLSQAKDSAQYYNKWRWLVRSKHGDRVLTDRLLQAWKQVVHKHALLRSIFVPSHSKNGSYHNQLVLTRAPPELFKILPTSDMPFSKYLELNPLPILPQTQPQNRLVVRGTSHGHAECLLEINHTLIDGLSTQILLHDLRLAYNDELDSTPTKGYKQYVKFVRDQPIRDSRAYWKEYLHGVEPCLLPKMKRSQDPSVLDEPQTTFHLKLEFGQQLRNFCSKFEVTMASVFQLGWSLVLQTYLNESTACFGYITSGRDAPIPDIDKTVGPFINMLVCCIAPREGENILDLLRRNQIDFLKSLEYQHLSLAEKVKSTGRSDIVLFNTAMSVLKEQGEPLTSPNLNFSEFGGDNPTEYDLTVNIKLLDENINIALEYSTSLFSDEHIEILGDTFQQALLSIISGHRQLPFQLDMLGSLSKSRVLDLNSEIPEASEECLHDLVRERCLAQPDAPAVCAHDGDFTYAEIDQMSSILSGNLTSRGVGPDAFVPLCFEKSRWSIIALLGVIKAGGAFVLLDISFPFLRLQEICSTINPTVILSSKSKQNLAASLVPEVVVVSDEDRDWFTRDVSTPQHCSSPSNALYAVFTSGSTGKPKGAVIEHRSFVTSARAYSAAHEMNTSSRVLQYTSYAWDVSIVEHFSTLLMGGCICVPSEAERREDYATIVANYQANWAFLTPSMARIMDPSEFPTLNTLVIGGDAVGTKELDLWHSHVNLFLIYGPTETSVFCSTTSQIGPGSDGRVLGQFLGSNAWVVSPSNHDILLPYGAVGELLIEGPIVGRGYLNDSRQSELSFISAPTWVSKFARNTKSRFYKTGDLVCYRDGEVRFVGRKDFQTKIRGQRLEIGDLEQNLRSLFPGAEDIVADIVKPAGGSAMLIAFVCPNRETKQDTNQRILLGASEKFLSKARKVERELATAIPAYMVPSRFYPIRYVPMTPQKKIDRKRLREAILSLSFVETEQYNHFGTAKQQPSTESEISLHKIWAKVLNKPKESIGVHDSFFLLGGDSISAMQVASQAKYFGISITVADIFRRKTISQLGLVMTNTNSATQMSDIVDSPFQLSPIQKLFFQISPEGCSRFNQEYFIRLTKQVTSEKVAAALQHIVQQHSMLRAKFNKDNRGQWMQVIRPFSEETYRYREHCVPSMVAAESIIAESQKRLNISDGPVFSAEVINITNETYLFLTAHHLVIDLVSWRVILEDLENYLTIGAIPKTPSFPFQSWCQLQETYVNSSLVEQTAVLTNFSSSTQEQEDYWGILGKSNTFEDVVEQGFCLDQQTTSSLFQDANNAFQTQPVELFQAAIIYAFAQTFCDRAIPAIWNEGHGREPWDSSIDIARTVGWFTTLWPLKTEISGFELSELVRQTKDKGRSILRNGWEYFTSSMLRGTGIESREILFNYVGQYQQLDRSDSLFQSVKRSAASELGAINERMQRLADIEISTFTKDNCLNFIFYVHKHAVENRPIKTWISACEQSLRMIAGDFPFRSLNYTLSDFPLIPFTYDTLEEFMIRTLPDCGISSTEVVDVYPCSPIQRGILLSQAKGDNTLYLSFVVWRIQATNFHLDIKHVIEAWRKIVSRHTILQTVFVKSTTESNFLDQVLLKVPVPEVHTIDSNDEETLIARLSEQRELTCHNGSLPYRFTVGQAYEGHIICALEISHSLFDGTTTQILQRELQLACDNSLPVGPGIPYKDYISFLSTKSETLNKEYWATYLQGISPCLLPTRDRNLAHGSGDEKLRSFRVEIGAKSILQEFCNRYQVTLSNLFQIAWGIVLKSFVGSDVICFGFLNSGRDIPIPGINDAVGPFINVLICHMQLPREQLLIKTLLDNQVSYIGGMEHQHCSLTEVLRAANLQNFGTLFNTLVSLQVTREGPAEGQSSIKVQVVGGEQVKSEYDLTLNIVIGAESIWTTLSYYDSRIDNETVQSISDTFCQVIMEIVSKPQGSIGDIQLLGERGWQTIKIWNKEEPVLFKERVDDLIHQKCLQHPESSAVCAYDGDFTYAEVDRLSSRLAGYLHEQFAIQSDAFIPLCFEKSRWAIIAMLGVMKAGAAFILLDPSYPLRRLQEICEIADASFVLSSEAQSYMVSNIALKMFAIGDNEQVWNNASFNSKLLAARRASLSPRDVLYAVFTSGSTGKPKGIVIEHQAFVTSAMGQMRRMHVDETSRVLQYSSYAFDVAVGDILVPLLAGGCVCIPSDMERKDLSVLPRAVARLRANWVFFTFTVAKLLDPVEYPSLRTVFVGGEQISESEVQHWQRHGDLYFSYGPAEASVHCAVSDKVTPMTSGRDFGRPYSCRMWVVEQHNTQNLAPIGSIGELVIEGHLLARHYLKDPERTEKSFIKAPRWLEELGFDRSTPVYKTGDLVKYNNNDGSLYYVSRNDTQVKLRGQRLELGEIQHYLRKSFPNIEDVVTAVVNFSKLERTPALVAFISVKQKYGASQNIHIFDAPTDSFKGATISAISKLDQNLPLWMVPTIFIPISRMPLTQTGKTDRRALVEAAAALTSQEISAFASSELSKRAPRDNKEENFRQMFATLFSLDPTSIGIDEHFFRLGGDSITAMKLIPMARGLGYGINIADIFNNPKLRDLAATSRVVTIDDAQKEAQIAHFSLILNRDEMIEAAADTCQVPVDLIEDIYPSSPLQEGLIALSMKTAGHYVATFKYELGGEIDVRQYQIAWNETVKANPILRTRLFSFGAKIFQVVVDKTDFCDIYDSQEAYDRGRKLLKVDMGKELVRFALVKASPGSTDGSFKFYLTIHHALYDSSSLPLLWSQVQEAYDNKPLAHRPYSGFIKATSQIENAETFWKDQFSGLSAPIFPAFQSSRCSPSPTSSVSHTIFNLQCTAIKYTSSTLIRLAWAIIISAYTDSNEVIFGVTNNGRDAAITCIDQLTGPTIATFPLRVRLNPTDSVDAQLLSIQKTMTNAIPYQQVGLQYIRQFGEDAATACNFQCHFGIQAPTARIGSTIYKSVKSEHEDYRSFANYALVIVCHLPEKGSNDLIIAVSFDEGVLDSCEVKRMMQQFEGVLRQVSDVCHENSRLDSLDLICPEDYDQLLNWNSAIPPSHEACLHDLVLHHSFNRPNDLAIESWDGDLTYGELKDQCHALATYLQALGIQPRHSVPLCFERSKWSVVAMIAVLQLGANCVCLDPAHPKDRIHHIVKRTAADFILTSPTNQHLFEGLSQAIAISVPIIEDDEAISTFCKIIVSPHDVGFIVFTSGSTGVPKGVLLEHANLATSVQSYSSEMQINHKTRGLHFASYAFDASIYEIFGTLIYGGILCIPSEYDKMNDITLFINEYRVNWMFFTPSAISLIKPEDVPDVETIVLGGEAVTQENVRTWASKVKLVNGYGPAESTVCAVGRLPESGWKQGTIGRVSGGLGWITMPNDPSRLAPIGAIGELLIQGPVLSRGYLHDPETSAKSFFTDPAWLHSFQPNNKKIRLYRSGDLFQYGIEGAIRYIGRKDTQVKLRGQRIELGEIEERLKQAFPGVPEVVAEVVNSSGSAAIVAFISNAMASSNLESALFEDLFSPPTDQLLTEINMATRKIRQQLPDYMIPTLYLHLPKVPRTSSDKVDRKKLRDHAARLSRDQIRAFSPLIAMKREPITAREKKIHGLWVEVFDLPSEQLGLDDDFFDLGGDSITAMRLASLARQNGIRLDSSIIFNYPVLCDQAARINDFATDDFIEEYRPGALMGITDLETSLAQLWPEENPSLNAKNVVDILPVTEFQARLLEVKNTTYSRLRISTHVDIGRIERACRSLLQKYPTLRSFYASSTNGVCQIIQREIKYQLIKHRCKKVDLLQFSRDICLQDSLIPISHGSPHFQPYLISGTDKDHVFILRISHAAYDGVSLLTIWEDFTLAYGGHDLATTTLTIPRYLQFRIGQKNAKSYDFWRQYLDGSQVLNDNAICLSPSLESTQEVRVRSFKEISAPSTPTGITLASLARAAWSLVLAKRTGIKDLVFGNIVNGRDIPLQGIEKLPMPTVTIVPFRATIQSGWATKAFLDHVQAQFTLALPFTSIDFKDIIENSTSWPVDTKFGSILTHQDVNDYPIHQIDGKDTLWDLLDFGLSTDFHVVTWGKGDKFYAHVSGSSRMLGQEAADEIAQQLCETISLLSEDGQSSCIEVLV